MKQRVEFDAELFEFLSLAVVEACARFRCYPSRMYAHKRTTAESQARHAVAYCLRKHAMIRGGEAIIVDQVVGDRISFPMIGYLLGCDHSGFVHGIKCLSDDDAERVDQIIWTGWLAREAEFADIA